MANLFLRTQQHGITMLPWLKFSWVRSSMALPCYRGLFFLGAQQRGVTMLPWPTFPRCALTWRYHVAVAEPSWLHGVTMLPRPIFSDQVFQLSSWFAKLTNSPVLLGVSGKAPAVRYTLVSD